MRLQLRLDLPTFTPVAKGHSKTVSGVLWLGIWIPLLVWGFVTPSWLAGQNPFPQLLPPASSFLLTLQEDPHSNLPLGPSCGGVAEQTLHCRAFLLTLKNVGSDTVHIEDGHRYGVSMDRSRLGMSVTGGGTGFGGDDVRLKPGESIQRSVRGTGPGDPVSGEIEPGRYAIHAEWTLFGCKENPTGKECRHHLDDGRPFYPAQGPATVLSAEISVNEPQLHDLGDVKLELEVTAHLGKLFNAPSGCTSETNTIDCLVFHRKMVNLGEHTIRYMTGGCTSFRADDLVEFRTPKGIWRPMPPRANGIVACTASFSGAVPIFPGANESEFTLGSIGLDTKQLQEPGQYHFRLIFRQEACIASSDGSFCLMQVEDPVKVVSNEVEVNTTFSNH
jgi:hypothetical protein